VRIEVGELSLPSLDGLEVDSVAALVGAERPLAGLAALLDWRMAGAVSRAIRTGMVTPEHGEALLLPTQGRLRAPRLFLFGVDDPSPRSATLAVRHACEALRRAGAREVAVALPHGAPLAASARAWVEASGPAGFARQVVLGDPRALLPALEGAARDLGVALELVRLAARVEPPAPPAPPAATA
jgi:hypothetical protein